MIELDNLIEQYERRIKTASELLENAGYERNQIRLTAKKGCFQNTLVELQRLKASVEEQEDLITVKKLRARVYQLQQEKFVTPKIGLFGEKLHRELQDKIDKLQEEITILEDKHNVKVTG